MKKTLLLLLAISLTSCGARKVQKSETKEETKITEVVTEMKMETIAENTKIVDSSEVDEIEIAPVDSSKPMVVNGKTYFNAKIKRVNRKNNIVIDKIKKVDRNEEKHAKKDTQNTKEVKQKEVERSGITVWWLVFSWILLILFIYVCYRINKHITP